MSLNGFCILFLHEFVGLGFEPLWTFTSLKSHGEEFHSSCLHCAKHLLPFVWKQPSTNLILSFCTKRYRKQASHMSPLHITCGCIDYYNMTLSVIFFSRLKATLFSRSSYRSCFILQIKLAALLWTVLSFHFCLFKTWDSLRFFKKRSCWKPSGNPNTVHLCIIGVQKLTYTFRELQQPSLIHIFPGM